jgi:phosphoribosylformylglycinamidine synthase subunit PurQ / glutaminase
MKFGVVTFPGSNCDQDLIYALSTNLGQRVVNLWHKDHDLLGCDFILLPGGFSYGDYLRSGAIARFSPIMDEVAAHAKKGGYVMGICNGFQVLTEAGLLEGALIRNSSCNFVCKNVFIRPATKNSILTSKLMPNKGYKIPIAHGEGNFFAPADLLRKIEDNDQVLFHYCNEKGIVGGDANPNGSLNDIAGITNAGRNVFGMMPHPERAADNLLGNLEGLKVLESLLA